MTRLSSRKSTPNVFVDELHHPSVKLPSEEELASPDPESALVATVRAIPAWTEPYLAYLLRGELPEDEVNKDNSSDGARPMQLLMGNCTEGVSPESTRDVCLQRKVSKSCKRFMQVIVVIMHPLDHWCQKLSGTRVLLVNSTSRRRKDSASL